jgi:lipopolysaccharide transport system ATP-binding protein
MNSLPIGTIVFDKVSKRYRLGALGTLRNTVAALMERRKHDEDSQNLWALKEVSFRVEPGDSLGLIGPNGAGKTTTLKLLSNITQPTSGRISVSGRFSSLIELGAGFHPELTGRENIFLNGAILGLSRREIQRRLDEIIAFSELERFIDTPVKRYSSGMYVRLGFAVAAHVEPDVLLIDEVLAVGDASFRQKSLKRMEVIRKKGTTIVFVSHNMHLIKRLCRNALLLSQGKILAEGSPQDVIRAYEKQSLTDEVAESHSDTYSSAILNEAVVCNVQKVECQEFAHGDLIRLNIRYTTPQPIPSVILRARLINDEGMVVAMVTNHHQDHAHLYTLVGSGFISLTFPSVEVISGHYHFEVRLLDSTDSEVLAMINSASFYVTSPGFGYEVDRGVYRPRVEWSLTQDDRSV